MNGLSLRGRAALFGLFPLGRRHRFPDAECVDRLDLLGEGSVDEAVSGERGLSLELLRDERHCELRSTTVAFILDITVSAIW